MICFSRISAGVFLASCLSLNTAQAACGLDKCPIDNTTTNDADVVGLGSLRITKAPDTNAFYSEAFAGLHLSVTQRLSAGAVVPVVSTWHDDANQIGLGNVVAYMEYAETLKTKDIVVSAGLQIETPTAMHGLGDAHFLLLPYAQGWKQFSHWNGRVQAGWSRTLTGDHAHDHDTHHGLTINPHSYSEFLFRSESFASKIGQATTWQPGLGFELIQDLEHTDSTVVNAGLMLEHVRQALTVRLQVDFPFTDERRYDQRVTLRASFPKHPTEK